MADGESPAPVVDEALSTAPTATETPATETPASTDAGTQTPAPVTPSEPDYDALLANEEFVNKVLQHEKAQQRIKSVRDADIDRKAQERAAEIVRKENERLTAETNARLKQADEEREDEAAWREIEERLQSDPTDSLALRMRAGLEARRNARQSAAIEQQIMQRLMPNLQQQAEIQANRRIISMLTDAIAKDGTLSDEDRQALEPRNYNDHLSFLTAWAEMSSSRRAKELAKSLAKTEAAALVQEHLATSRKEEKGPVTLPPGEGGMTDDQFLRAYGRGEVTDHARARRLMAS